MSILVGAVSSILRKGAGARQALDQLQDGIAVTVGEIKTLEQSLLSYEETRAILLQSLKVGMYARTPENRFDALQRRDGERNLSIKLTLADLAYIEGPEVLAEKIMRRLESNGRTAGLPQAKYAADREGLLTKLDQLERDEEAEILRLEAAGHVVLRRESARPEILFQVWGERAERAAA